MRKLVIGCIALYVVALGLNFSTSLPNAGLNGCDIIYEYEDTQNIIANGWHLFETYSQNNTSIVMGLIVPALSKFMSTMVVFKVVLPAIFALTPPLLFLLYRRITAQHIAFIGALFFALLPPTWQEVPAIGKSTIAEPLAVGTLLVVFSKMDKKIRIPLVAILAVLTALAHYTLGFMLLAWLGCMAIGESISKRKISLLFIPIAVAFVCEVVWFSFASNGVVFYHLLHSPGMESDPFVGRLLGQTWLAESVWVKVQLILLYIALVVMSVGLYYLVRHYKEIDKRLIAGIAICATGVLVRVFLTKYTGLLLLSRWIQYGAICLSPLFAFGIGQIWGWYKHGGKLVKR